MLGFSQTHHPCSCPWAFAHAVPSARNPHHALSGIVLPGMCLPGLCSHHSWSMGSHHARETTGAQGLMRRPGSRWNDGSVTQINRRAHVSRHSTESHAKKQQSSNQRVEKESPSLLPALEKNVLGDAFRSSSKASVKPPLSSLPTSPLSDAPVIFHPNTCEHLSWPCRRAFSLSDSALSPGS